MLTFTLPPIATVNSQLFPPESVVGYPGTTITGVEPAAAETARVYPYNNGSTNEFPLVAPLPYGEPASSPFDIKKYWGNLSPWYSLSSSNYGLPKASPLIPPGCDIIQLHLLYRHGARYPTSGSAPATFASKVANATKNGGFKVSGDLAFLADWTYKLGAELLTPFGRSQNFLLGVEHRQLYGQLLNNFTEQGTIPVFRTESQDRMVKTANNFAAGFFGVPEYLDEVNIEILVEAPGLNNSGAPYETCTNADVTSRGAIGSTVATAFAHDAFNSTIARLNSLVRSTPRTVSVSRGQVALTESQVEGITFTPTDAVAMLQLCSYETVALGDSAFCSLFSQEDYLNYEYYYDLVIIFTRFISSLHVLTPADMFFFKSFYYNNGPGSPVSAAQGKGYLQEWVGRFTGTYPAADSALNETYDDNPTYFPLNQSIYADATHEVVILDTLTAFNLTALFAGEPLSLTDNKHNNTFEASKIVPFATHFTAQVLECPAYQPTKQIRFLV